MTIRVADLPVVKWRGQLSERLTSTGNSLRLEGYVQLAQDCFDAVDQINSLEKKADVYRKALERIEDIAVDGGQTTFSDIAFTALAQGLKDTQ